MFLIIDVELIYVVTWRNEERLTKSQMFRLLVILVFNPRNARDHFMNIFKSITEDIFK